MLLGILFILAGILLIVYPQLLAFFVAFMFFLAGSSLIYMSFYYKRTARRFDDPVMDFMFRL